MPASASILGLTVLSVYSGALISRLSRAAGGAMHFGDIGEAAGGTKVISPPFSQIHTTTHSSRLAGLRAVQFTSGHRGRG